MIRTQLHEARRMAVCPKSLKFNKSFRSKHIYFLLETPHKDQIVTLMSHSRLLLCEKLANFINIHACVTGLILSISDLENIYPFLGHLQKYNAVIIETDNLWVIILIWHLRQTGRLLSLQQIESLVISEQFCQKIRPLRIP